jgi:hypothetical protein
VALTALLLALGAGESYAGSRFIGNVSVPAGTGALSGIAFDDVDSEGRPLVAKSNGEAFRISLSTAATEIEYSLPASNTVRGLAYRGQGSYFQTRGQPGNLYTINPLAGTALPSPNDFNTLYNFLDLAIDARSGQLWASTDEISPGFAGGGSLYTVNPSAGTLSFVTRIPNVGQLTSMAVGPRGEIYVAGSNNFGISTLYQVNPVTGAATLAATLNTPTGYMVDFAYRSETQKWYGLFLATSTLQAQFVEITNLPEPTTVFTGAALVAIGSRRRK